MWEPPKTAEGKYISIYDGKRGRAFEEVKNVMTPALMMTTERQKCVSVTSTFSANRQLKEPRKKF